MHTVCIHPKAQCAVNSYTRFGINKCDCITYSNSINDTYLCTFFKKNIIYLNSNDILYGCACDTNKFIILDKILNNFDHFKNIL